MLPAARSKNSRWSLIVPGGWICLLVVLLMIGQVGCGNSAERSSNNMKQLQLAIHEHAAENNGGWPDSLDQLKDRVGGEEAFRALMRNPLTGDDPGYEYVKPEGTANDPDTSKTVSLYQLRDGQRDTSLKVGYADGSVRALATN